MAIAVAGYAKWEGLLLEDIIVQLLVDLTRWS